MKCAYFAGGCFWCITPVFRGMEGVKSVTAGYCGGDEENPSYEDVKAQRTGHRETIRIEYDPDLISFRTLFSVFLNSVDPFDGDGQFIDRGRSYTPAVYCTEKDERETAEALLTNLAAERGKRPAVAVEPYKTFWPAESRHQDYDLKNPEAYEHELQESGRKNVSCPVHFRKEG